MQTLEEWVQSKFPNVATNVLSYLNEINQFQEKENSSNNNNNNNFKTKISFIDSNSPAASYGIVWPFHNDDLSWPLFDPNIAGIDLYSYDLKYELQRKTTQIQESLKSTFNSYLKSAGVESPVLGTSPTEKGFKNVSQTASIYSLVQLSLEMVKPISEKKFASELMKSFYE